MALLALVLLLAGVAVGIAAEETRPCAASLPAGPPVPEPVVFRNSCGGFLLDRGGRVTRVPAEWFAGGETGRRYGADLRIRRTRAGAYVVRRQGAVVWRSSGLYRNDGGSLAFGPRAFAFAAYKRGVFLSDLRRPERLVVRGVGLYPVAFRRDGSLLVAGYEREPSIRVVSSEGTVARRYRYRAANGFAFEQRGETLLYVTPTRILVRLDGDVVRVVRPLGRLDGWLSVHEGQLTLSDFAHRSSRDEIRYAVLRGDGTIASRLAFRSPKGTRIDMGPAPSPDSHTFALRTVEQGKRRTVTVYVLRRDERRAEPVLRHAGNRVGCGVGVTFAWNGRRLLYSATDGPAALVDTEGDVLHLGKLVRQLPHSWPRERAAAYWLRDLAAARAKER